MVREKTTRMSFIWSWPLSVSIQADARRLGDNFSITNRTDSSIEAELASHGRDGSGAEGSSHFVLPISCSLMSFIVMFMARLQTSRVRCLMVSASLPPRPEFQAVNPD
jgi:hypothetical protein